MRPLDPDNAVYKFHIDALRYAGVIPNDDPETIVLQASQTKVRHKYQECCRVEIRTIAPGSPLALELESTQWRPL